MMKQLQTTDHSRSSAGLVYVYPVVSRRAGGVSVGINLNTNNACNWRCIYCQVPELKKGSAPPVDLPLLASELRGFLHEIIHGNFMQERVPEGFRVLKDIAISGNGEPTSCKEFAQVIDVISQVLQETDLASTKLVLITNGSLLHQARVQQGLKKMRAMNAEIWFKLDSATVEGRRLINNSAISGKRVRENLRIAAGFCPTRIQSCFFQIDGQPPADRECDAYLDFLKSLDFRLEGVLLYGPEREILQDESLRISRLSQPWIEEFAEKIRQLGLTVGLSF